ncbi:MAG: glutathione S-transferase family protein [Deltaproteobacteria bacterium]
MITLYGSAQNRGSRCILVLEECGLDYQIKPIDIDNGAQNDPAYRAINPNGKVPCLDDDGFVVWESMAVNLYLAGKYGNGLIPEDTQARAKVLQWSFWAMTELEAAVLSVFTHRVQLPEEDRRPEIAQQGMDKTAVLLAVLDGELEGNDYLIDNGFTVADLNVAHVVIWATLLGVSIEKYKNVGRWFASIQERPSFQKLMDMRS